MSLVLVTGGAGFIGSHLVEALVNGGHQVRVLDNLSTGSLENLSAVENKIEFVRGSITQPLLVRAMMADVERVFHLAAMSSVPQSMAEPEKTMEVNAQGTLTVMRAAADAGAKAFVNISSAAVYGSSPKLPKRESMSAGSLSPYALSKHFTEECGKMFTRAFNLPVVSLRYFNVYGPRQRPDSDYAAVIPRFIDRMASGKPPMIFGDGEQLRDFVYVKDVAKATMLASETPEAAGGVFNIASGAIYSLLDLVEAINSALGTSLKPEFAPTRAGDIKLSYADVNRAWNRLGYKAEYTFEEGIRRTVQFALDQQSANEEVQLKAA